MSDQGYPGPSLVDLLGGYRPGRRLRLAHRSGRTRSRGWGGSPGVGTGQGFQRGFGAESPTCTEFFVDDLLRGLGGTGLGAVSDLGLHGWGCLVLHGRGCLVLHGREWRGARGRRAWRSYTLRHDMAYSHRLRVPADRPGSPPLVWGRSEWADGKDMAGAKLRAFDVLRWAGGGCQAR